jgi:hypothetical protein
MMEALRPMLPDYAIIAPHPSDPDLFIGVKVDAFNESDAQEAAAELVCSYNVPGILWGYDNTTTAGIYIVTYSFRQHLRMTGIEADSLDDARLFMQQIAEDGTLFTPATG